MKAYRWVRLDPTGNITALVLSPVPEPERAAVTAALLEESEQVGYLTAPEDPACRAGLCMMGHEFCGNASMAAAAWLGREDGMLPGEERTLKLEVSGAKAPVRCDIRAPEEPSLPWIGTVEMPPVLEVQPAEAEGRFCVIVRMEGITHLIYPGRLPDRETAERLLRDFARGRAETAVGLLQWDEEHCFMTPLVYVRESGSMTWETGCGSGSTAVGAWKALLAGEGTSVLPVRQPGGCLKVGGTVKEGKVTRLTICGQVKMDGQGTRICQR